MLSSKAMVLEILPYGVGHADEGICLLLRIGPYRILLDCGLENIDLLKHPELEGAENATNPLPADLVLCSHAHPDHARGLLALHQSFPELPIYGTEVTCELLPLNWLGEEAQTQVFCMALPWRKPVELLEGLTVELFRCGHLPGAAAILLTYRGSGGENFPHPLSILYTGDFLLSNSRLVEGLPLEELRGLQPQVLILEGSYGTSRLQRRRVLENQLAERIYQAIASGNSVLLPTPALGMGQELLILLRSHHQFTGRDLDIWVDGKVAAGCDAYLEILPQLPASVQNFARHQPLFWDERVRPRVRRFRTENYNVGDNDTNPLLGTTPAIVLTDTNADISRYCQPNTGPWLILLPEKPGFPRPDGNSIIKNANLQVETYLLSEHADASGTTQLVHNLRPQHVIFIHGSPNYLADLANLDELRSRYHLHTPTAGTLVELPIGDTPILADIADATYEGELTEESGVVTITIPEEIGNDPRWKNFADTGLVQARWQGEELVLRGISQRELLTQGSDARVSPEYSCCGNCLYYRGMRCWHQASPLFGFKVTTEGYCPVFERATPRFMESDATNLENTDFPGTTGEG